MSTSTSLSWILTNLGPCPSCHSSVWSFVNWKCFLTAPSSASRTSGSSGCRVTTASGLGPWRCSWGRRPSGAWASSRSSIWPTTTFGACPGPPSATPPPWQPSTWAGTTLSRSVSGAVCVKPGRHLISYRPPPLMREGGQCPIKQWLSKSFLRRCI